MCTASNALYIVLVLWKQMSIEQTSETVNAKRRITQIVAQWVPGSRASNSECPTTVRAEIVSRHNQVMTTGGTKMSSTGWNFTIEAWSNNGRLGGVVVRTSDLWSRDREFDSRPVHCRAA